MGGEIGGALEVVKDATGALPGDGDAGGVVRGRRRQHGQNGGGIGGVQASDPILIDVEACAIEVCKIHRAVYGQAVLLEVGVGDDGCGRLIFVRADVHGAAGDAGIAVEVGGAGDVNIVAGIDAGGSGLEMEVVSSLIYEERGVGDVSKTVGCETCSATIVERRLYCIRIIVPAIVIIENAILSQSIAINAASLDG